LILEVEAIGNVSEKVSFFFHPYEANNDSKAQALYARDLLQTRTVVMPVVDGHFCLCSNTGVSGSDILVVQVIGYIL
jgi:hypothetical protein